MNTTQDNAPLLKAVADASQFCYNVENALSVEREEFVKSLVTLLQRLYLDFVDRDVEPDDDFTFSPMLDEMVYDRMRAGIERQLGPDDTFLETFEVAISEALADIYQDLYEFTMQVRLSDGDSLREAFGVCRENFRLYWGQKLCNVMRPLNFLYTNGFTADEQ